MNLKKSRAFALSSLVLLTVSCGTSHKAQRVPVTKPPTTERLPQPVEPSVEPNLHIYVAYPVSGQPKPAVDSNFIFGSTGNGNAELSINGYLVPLAKNGAFLAFLPMPADGIYHLSATRGADHDSTSVSYAPSAAAQGSTSGGDKRSSVEAFHAVADVVKGSDTLQTGNDVTPGAPTPGADRKWFFPRGTQLNIEAKSNHEYKVALDNTISAWVADSNLAITAPRSTGALAGDPTSRRAGDPHLNEGLDSSGLGHDYYDLTLPCQFAPFLISTTGSSLTVKLYHELKMPRFLAFSNQTDPGFSVEANGDGHQYTVNVKPRIWGYKAFYKSDGSLVVRVRRPPTVDATEPVKGIHIMIDPGHPPGGAIGPTGLTEREANLAIATRVRDQLVRKGAIVTMTHSNLEGLVSSTNQVQELNARTALAVEDNVDMMVSIHNNAFPDGVNPFPNYGTNAYYYHPFSAALAGELDREIASVTGIPNQGAHQKSLAVCRPTWMPCALTESLYMMFPDQEQALRDPAFLDRLAAAHVRGIENFLRARAY